MRSARALLLYTVALWTVIVMFLLTLDAINRLDTQQGDTESPDALDIGHDKPPGQYAVTLKTILGNDAYALFEKSITGTPTSSPPTTPKHGEETAKPEAPLAKLLEKPKGKSNENLSTLAKPKQEEAASKAKLAEMWSSDEILPMLFKSSYALPIRTPPTHAKLNNALGSSRVKR